MRTEAQKKADAKYQSKKSQNYKYFGCVFANAEMEQINNFLERMNMSKTELVRYAIKILGGKQ